MNNKEEALLKIDHLCQYFRMGQSELKAVDDVSFEVKKGEVFGLVGESGCGKTTTGRSIIKLYDITSGNVYFKGIRIAAGKRSYEEAIKKAKEDYKAKIEATSDASKKEQLKKELADFVAEQKRQIKTAVADQKRCDKKYISQQVAEVEKKYLPMIEKATGSKKSELEKEYRDALRKAKKTKLITQIQMIFQDPMTSLNPIRTVGAQLTETILAHRKTSALRAQATAIRLLKKVGIANAKERMKEYPFQFSGGQRQRIMIAMALCLHPDILIADEPTTALDVTVQAQILKLIKDLQTQNQMAAVFITHNLAIVADVADEVLVLYGGYCVEKASVEELFSRPLHPYTQGLLCSLVSVRDKQEKLPAIEGYPPAAGQTLSGCPFAPRCPKACAKCHESLPPLFTKNGHEVRCWLWEEKA